MDRGGAADYPRGHAAETSMRVRVNCILPITARKADFGTLCLISGLWMTAPMSYFVSGVTTPETAMAINM